MEARCRTAHPPTACIAARNVSKPRGRRVKGPRGSQCGRAVSAYGVMPQSPPKRQAIRSFAAPNVRQDRGRICRKHAGRAVNAEQVTGAAGRSVPILAMRPAGPSGTPRPAQSARRCSSRTMSSRFAARRPVGVSCEGAERASCGRPCHRRSRRCRHRRRHRRRARLRFRRHHSRRRRSHQPDLATNHGPGVHPTKWTRT